MSETLSDKKFTEIGGDIPEYFLKEDVKEAIKELISCFPPGNIHAYTGDQFRFAIKEVFGKELVE